MPSSGQLARKSSSSLSELNSYEEIKLKLSRGSFMLSSSSRRIVDEVLVK